MAENLRGTPDRKPVASGLQPLFPCSVEAQLCANTAPGLATMESGSPDSMHALAGAQQAVVFPTRIAALGSRHVELDAPLPCDVQVGPPPATTIVLDFQDQLASLEPVFPPTAKARSTLVHVLEVYPQTLGSGDTAHGSQADTVSRRWPPFDPQRQAQVLPCLAIAKLSGGSFERMQARCDLQLIASNEQGTFVHVI